jgi:hypothetical protein
MCRPCRKQRTMIAHRDGQRPRDLSPAQARAVGHQLFVAVAGVWHQEGAGKRPYAKKTVPADMSLLRPAAHRQLVLLEIARDMRAGLVRGFPPPPDPALEAAFHQFVREHAARHGWTKSKAERIQRAIRIMLGLQDTPGAPIRRSDVALLSRIKHSAAVVTDVLAAAGMLEDDRVPPIERWFPLQIGDLPAPMREELAVWFQVARAGSASAPRMRPRTDTVVANHLRWALPALRQWAATHPSLREIGRDEVLAVLPPDARKRAPTLTGLRSIFRVLKARKLVFANPTNRLSVPTPDKQAPAPVDLEVLRAALDSDDPTEALITALLAFHAVRIHQLTAIRLTDIADGRLRVGDQMVLLAEPVRRRVTAYLDYRARTWPTSINPYLFLHARNWGTTRHVTVWWVRHQLRLPGQLIRRDRIFDEAVTTGGDIRALCDLFGLSVAGAYQYTALIDHVVDPRIATSIRSTR